MTIPKQNGAEISVYRKQSKNVPFPGLIQEAVMPSRALNAEKLECFWYQFYYYLNVRPLWEKQQEGILKIAVPTVEESPECPSLSSVHPQEATFCSLKLNPGMLSFPKPFLSPLTSLHCAHHPLSIHNGLRLLRQEPSHSLLYSEASVAQELFAE